MVKKFLIGVIIVLTSFILGVVVIYNRSVSPYNQAEEEALVIAEREAGVNNVDEFYWYNGTETYFTVTGTTENDEELIVIIRQDDGSIVTLPVNETISKNEAIRQVIDEQSPERILQARIGLEGETPVWEVSYRNENGRIGYYTLALENGEWIRTIDNI